MTQNSLVTRAPIAAPTPQVARSLSPQQLDAHRETIASEVKTVLSAYFQPHEDERIKAAQLAWWCDELEDWTHEQVVWGLRKWNRDNPRARPTPGDIVAILKQARGKKIASQMKEQENRPEPREKLSPERAAEIVREAGFAVRRMP